MVFFLDNAHCLYFHFYLYNVREENEFHFEKFDKPFFAFCLLQFCCTIANARRSLLLMVVCSNAKPKLFRYVTKLHQISLSTKKDCFSIFPFVRTMFHLNSQPPFGRWLLLKACVVGSMILDDLILCDLNLYEIWIGYFQVVVLQKEMSYLLGINIMSNYSTKLYFL